MRWHRSLAGVVVDELSIARNRKEITDRLDKLIEEKALQDREEQMRHFAAHVVAEQCYEIFPNTALEITEENNVIVWLTASPEVIEVRVIDGMIKTRFKDLTIQT